MKVRVVTGYRLDRRDDGDWTLTEVVHLFDRPLFPDTMQRQEMVLAVEETLPEVMERLTWHATQAGLT